MRAILITPENGVSVIRLRKKNGSCCDDIRTAIGGSIALVPWIGEDQQNPCDAYADDEGILKQLPTNYHAWTILSKLGFYVSTLGLWGNVLLIGTDPQTDEEKSVSAALINRIEKSMVDEEEY